jgi:class 3 adenylate cyclase/predicted ATPase
MRYVFGGCTLDTVQYVLYRENRSIPLQPKVFHVLEYLLTHRDRVIAKQELCEQVWPKSFISDATVEGVVKAIRRAVGDDGRTQWCIQTRRGQGYRFIAPLEEPADTVPETRSPAVSSVFASQDISPQVPAVEVFAPPNVSRRQLTVLCCELVGSLDLSTQLDPEDFQEVILAYHAVCHEVIERHAGFVAQHLGHGLLVYFGHPRAHEDDARRAVRAGLNLLEAVEALNTQRQGDATIRLTPRIGLHTGTVVVGEIGSSTRQAPLAFGATPRIAAGLQGIAEPHTVVMSAATYRLVRGFFLCKDLGKQALQDMTEPIAAYRVLGESWVQSRFDLAHVQGLTPLVGRVSEMTLLQERWAQAKDGLGHVVLLSGEPGLGKSRLGREIKEHVMGDGGNSIEFRCSPYHIHSAFYPVIGYIQERLQFRQDELPQEKLGKLERALRAHPVSMEDIVPLFAAFLSLPPPTCYPPLMMSPDRQKQKTLEALVAWLLAEAERQPVLVIWEDLQWADPSTLELLGHLIDQVAMARLLCLTIFRPSFQPSWPLKAHLTQMALNRLSRSHVQHIGQQAVGGKALPEAVVQYIVDKTDGVPLFVEELIAMLLESDVLREVRGHYELTGSTTSLAIPATLQDALMARLDRLELGRKVACLGATLGRAFSYELIQAVSLLDEETLQHGLTQLVDSELLYRQGFPPQTRYVFKHALIRDTAYQSLLRRTRCQYHQRIAEVLAARFPHTVATQPELVAYHFEEAGCSSEAISYWQQAGRRAVERSAYAEALAHLRKGLELLETLPETHEHLQQELSLQGTLGLALSATKGYGALDVEDAYLRARQLCQQLGDTPQLLPVLEGLSRFYRFRADFQMAYDLAEQMRLLAQRDPDTGYLALSHLTLGVVSLFRGELRAARASFEQGVACYAPQQVDTLTSLRAHDSDVTCRSFMALTLWLLGYPDQARVLSHQALTHARVLSHAHILAVVCGLAADLYLSLRETRIALVLIEEGLTLSTEQAFAFWVAMQTMQQGAALAMCGQVDAGITQLRQGLAGWRTTGAKLAGTRWHALLAEAYGLGGRVEEGLAVLSETLAWAAKTGESFWQAELYRLQGALLLRQTIPDELQAEACFHQAVDVARRQGAKTLELRAVMSLCRLWQQQGKRAEARDLLTPVYAWFIEGFDIADLREARAFLDELA